MIFILPYLLRHWLRLNDDERLYYPMQGSVGQLNLQHSVYKSTPHRRKHGESCSIRWRSFNIANIAIYQSWAVVSFPCVCLQRSGDAELQLVILRMGMPLLYECE